MWTLSRTGRIRYSSIRVCCNRVPPKDNQLGDNGGKPTADFVHPDMSPEEYQAAVKYMDEFNRMIIEARNKQMVSSGEYVLEPSDKIDNYDQKQEQKRITEKDNVTDKKYIAKGIGGCVFGILVVLIAVVYLYAEYRMHNKYQEFKRYIKYMTKGRDKCE